MLLVFDVGNTNMVLGIYEGDTLTNSWRINTDHQKSSDEYGILINNLFEYHRINMRDVKHIIISSVVPDVMHSLENFCIKYCGVEPLIVGPGIKTGLNIKYDNPKQVGADRIVNAVAAIEKYGYPLIIVDFGTARGNVRLLHFGRNAGASVHNDAAIGRHGGANGFYALQIQSRFFGINAVHGAKANGQRIHAGGAGKFAGLLRVGKVFTDFGVCQRLSAMAVFAGGCHYASPASTVIFKSCAFW